MARPEPQANTDVEPNGCRPGGQAEKCAELRESLRLKLHERAHLIGQDKYLSEEVRRLRGDRREVHLELSSELSQVLALKEEVVQQRALARRAEQALEDAGLAVPTHTLATTEVRPSYPSLLALDEALHRRLEEDAERIRELHLRVQSLEAEGTPRSLQPPAALGLPLVEDTLSSWEAEGESGSEHGSIAVATGPLGRGRDEAAALLRQCQAVEAQNAQLLRLTQPDDSPTESDAGELDDAGGEPPCEARPLWYVKAEERLAERAARQVAQIAELHDRIQAADSPDSVAAGL